jgi:hypothetical protein
MATGQGPEVEPIIRKMEGAGPSEWMGRVGGGGWYHRQNRKEQERKGGGALERTRKAWPLARAQRLGKL